MTEKRLPQVGEICWSAGLTYTNEDIWVVTSPTLIDNLAHIHTDATGKVINPTFPGDQPMKKQTQVPVDPFTIDWPKSAFKVGEKYVLKPNKKDESNDMLDWSEAATLITNDGSYCLEFRDHKGEEAYEDLILLAPLSEVEKYRAAIAGQKPPKPPKPDPIAKALEASRERTKDLEALQELTEKAKANKTEGAELAAKIRALKEKVGMK